MFSDIKLILIIVFTALIFSACEKEETRPPFSPYAGMSGQELQFSPSVSGSAYHWNFGDSYVNHLDNISREKAPVHTYEYKGIYHVVLTVDTKKGKVDFAKDITIE